MPVRLYNSTDFRALLKIKELLIEIPSDIFSFVESIKISDPCLIYEESGEITGFLLAISVLDEIQILDLMVAPPYQRQGIATILLQEIFLLGKSSAKKAVLLEVRESNTIARSLYEKLGFQALTMRKGYYDCLGGEREDAVVMRREIEV